MHIMDLLTLWLHVCHWQSRPRAGWHGELELQVELPITYKVGSLKNFNSRQFHWTHHGPPEGGGGGGGREFQD